MLNSKAMSRAKRIKSQNESEWMKLEGVVAVGVGLVDGRPGIIISVKRAAGHLREQMPYEIEEIPIKIEISGEISAD